MPSRAAGLEATVPWRVYPAQRLALLVPVVVLVELGILRRGLSVARSHPRVLSAGGHGLAGPHQLHAEVPLVAVVEEEEELLLARRAGKGTLWRRARRAARGREPSKISGVLSRAYSVARSHGLPLRKNAQRCGSSKPNARGIA